MSPIGQRLAIGLVLVAVGTAGCASARQVSVHAHGGCVAIPDNSNHWPFYHRDKAVALIAQQCPNGYIIEREEEVVIGQTVNTHTDTDTHQYDHPALKGLGLTAQTTRQTSNINDQTEWRIWYQKK
jgi:hypothetical protein